MKMNHLDIMELSNLLQNTEASRKAGRKANKDTLLRSLFFSTKRKKMPPKKEYLRCKLIRGHKRANRQIEKSIKPTKTLHKFNPENPKAQSYWKKLTEIYFQNYETLGNTSLTISGPRTDGKHKRQYESSYMHNSFNEKFCQQYFKEVAVRKSFYYYVKLVFSEFNPETLCEKFEFRCCAGEHFGECYQKWKGMKLYILNDMIRDLGWEPWSPKLETNLLETPVSKIECCFECRDTDCTEDLGIDGGFEPSWTKRLKHSRSCSAFKVHPAYLVNN